MHRLISGVQLGSLLLLGLWATGCAAPVPRDGQRQVIADRPNIVVFVADDLGWNDIGFHNPEVRTPHLDRLAQAGVRLEHFYVFPTCSPTRTALLTGRNPSRFGILRPISWESRQALPAGTVTLATRLRQLGYTTAITGKWHLGLRPEVGPRQYGFDFTYGFLHGEIDPYTHRYETGARTWHRNDVFVDEEGHVTDLLTREAIAFIELHRDRPFFLYVPFSAPHKPLNEPEQWTQPYAQGITNDSRRRFLASVSHMDNGIGQICEKLDSLGLTDNTLIVFLSDNGGRPGDSTLDTISYEGRYPIDDQLGDNRSLRGWKGELYEGGIRVPAFMHWPKQFPPHIANDVISVLDITPTLVAVAGGRQQAATESNAASTDPPFEGIDIWSALTGKAPTGQRTLYWNTGGARALRMGDWKLISDKAGRRSQLFDLAEDPYEKTDWAGEQPERVRQMLDRLREQQAQDPGGAPGN